MDDNLRERVLELALELERLAAGRSASWDNPTASVVMQTRLEDARRIRELLD